MSGALLGPGNLETHKDESNTVLPFKTLGLRRDDRQTQTTTILGREGH